jgi:hypothetical protein
MTAPATIGQCRACLQRPRRIEAGSRVCAVCVAQYGRRMVALAIRAREDPTFRAKVRAELGKRSPSCSRLFDLAFGPVLREVTTATDQSGLLRHRDGK